MTCNATKITTFVIYIFLSLHLGWFAPHFTNHLIGLLIVLNRVYSISLYRTLDDNMSELPQIQPWLSRSVSQSSSSSAPDPLPLSGPVSWLSPSSSSSRSGLSSGWTDGPLDSSSPSTSISTSRPGVPLLGVGWAILSDGDLQTPSPGRTTTVLPRQLFTKVSGRSCQLTAFVPQKLNQYLKV